MESLKPWEQGLSLSKQDVKKIIEINFEDLHVDSVQPLGDGWDNTTWLINQSMVFRLPKHKEAADLLRHEINVLPNFPTFNVVRPRPAYIELKPKDFPFPIYGHAFVSGKGAEQYALNDAQRAHLAKPLGDFLRQLHAYSLTKDQAMHVPTQSDNRISIQKRSEAATKYLTYLKKHQQRKRSGNYALALSSGILYGSNAL